MNRNIKIPFSRPSIGKKEYSNVRRVLKSGWLTTGKYAGLLEENFKKLTGSSYALACSSGTAGLHLCAEALHIRPDSYVITTPYTFTSTAEIVRYLGAHPLFVDINPDTLNIDPEGIKEAVEKNRGRISAVIQVHIAGLPCDMDEIIDASADIPVIEDSAHAFPVKYKDRYCGTIGKAGVFSFYANKTITCGEGGLVLTDDRETAERISVMRLHGMTKTTWDRYLNTESPWKYDIAEAGYKYNLPDLNAAVGTAQFEKAWEFKAKRKKAADYYNSFFKDLDFLKLPESGTDHAWHLYIIRLKSGKLTISRDDFIKKLNNAGIGTSVHFIPLHVMTYYRKTYGFKPEDFRKAYSAYESAVSLPLFPGISEKELSYVVKIVTAIGKKYYNNQR